jgi:hypothetical protein
MKSKLLIFIFMLVFLCSCDPESLLNPPYRGFWYIRNNTSQNLYLLISSSSVDSIKIEPEDSVLRAYMVSAESVGLYFNRLKDSNFTNDSMEIFNDSGYKSLIIGWTELDTPHGHKFFFSESSWVSHSWHENLGDRKDYYTYRSWTYAVTDDDLKAWEEER